MSDYFHAISNDAIGTFYLFCFFGVLLGFVWGRWTMWFDVTRKYYFLNKEKEEKQWPPPPTTTP